MDNTTTTNLSPATALAVDRTRLAHDRTLLAWVRTATSLISFGFTIYKFFEYLQQQKEVSGEGHILGPRQFALVMISIGLIALAIATVQHRLDLKRMRTQYPNVQYSLATILAALIAILGVVSLLAVIFKQ